jgi:hypothetical protein
MRLIIYYLYAKFHLILANNNWAMLQFTIQKYTYPTNDVTRCAESAIHILLIFTYNFGTRWDRIEQ